MVQARAYILEYPLSYILPQLDLQAQEKVVIKMDRKRTIPTDDLHQVYA